MLSNYFQRLHLQFTKLLDPLKYSTITVIIKTNLADHLKNIYKTENECTEQLKIKGNILKLISAIQYTTYTGIHIGCNIKILSPLPLA